MRKRNAINLIQTRWWVLRLRVGCGCYAKREQKSTQNLLRMRAHRNSTNSANKVQNNKWKIVKTYLRCFIENRNYYRILCVRYVCVSVCIFLCLCNACINKCSTHFSLVSIAFFTSNKYFNILNVCVSVISAAGIVNGGVSTKVHYPILHTYT